MTSYVPPKKNASGGYTFYVSLAPRTATGTWQANPTLASGDVKIAIDDGAPANLGTLPVVDADFTKRVKVVLSQAETNGDNLTIIFSDASGAEWCDLTVNLQTVSTTLDEIDDKIDTIDGNVDSILTDTGTTLDGKIDAIKTVTDALPDSGALTSLATASALATVDSNVDSILEDTGTTLPGTLSTMDGKLDTIDNFLDTEIAAILEDTGTTIPAALAALESHGDSTWATATGFSTLDAAGIRTAVGLSSANLDTQLSTIDSEVGTIDTVVDGIKAVTDNLPDSGALSSLATASALTTVDGVVDAIKAVTDALPDSGALTSLATAAALQTVDDEIATLDGIADAIKAKTDDLTFTVSGVIDANITYVNETEIGGDGGTGTEFGPV